MGGWGTMLKCFRLNYAKIPLIWADNFGQNQHSVLPGSLRLILNFYHDWFFLPPHCLCTHIMREWLMSNQEAGRNIENRSFIPGCKYITWYMSQVRLILKQNLHFIHVKLENFIPYAAYKTHEHQLLVTYKSVCSLYYAVCTWLNVHKAASSEIIYAEVAPITQLKTSLRAAEKWHLLHTVWRLFNCPYILLALLI